MNTIIISTKKRKTIHIILFIIILIVQILIFKTWLTQKEKQNNLTTAIDDIVKPTKSLIYSNLAQKNYFEAENCFNDYLQTHNPATLSKYKSSLEKMTLYLDSIKIISNHNYDFSTVIKSKQAIEGKVIKLQTDLDSLMRIDFTLASKTKPFNFAIKKYNYTSILNSITFDTTKTITKAPQKGLFGRIGNAIASKAETNKVEVKSMIKMVYKNDIKTGTFEEQLKNIFLFTDKYYEIEMLKLKNTYFELQEKDRQLLIINQIILTKSQELLTIYSLSNEVIIKTKYYKELQVYNSDIKAQKHSILDLLLVLGVITILLLLYTIYAYIRENNLEKSKVEIEKNLEFKNRLIGMLSHEMRAPLNIISNITTKLKKNKTNIIDNINVLHFTSNSLQITVNQILEFFKHESSKLVTYNTKTNLQEELNSILESLKSLTESKKIDLITNIDPSTNANLLIDNGKIHQLFYNIIGNAIKFTKKGMITINCQLLPTGNKYSFNVKIKDTGVGIPKEDLNKVFNTKFQSEFHLEENKLGAGLGLNLCKEIVELYNGEISIESELDKGTEISFSLLLEEAPTSVTNIQATLKQKNTNKKLKIAIIDDDSISLSLIHKMVEKAGFHVVSFKKYEQIALYLQTEIVDILITDLNIAGKSGLDLVKETKALINKNNSCKIIAITGDIHMRNMDLEKAQIDSVLTKPFTKEEFYGKLLEMLS
ncbi:hybrid sensor histidine kinase/response regulator [Flavobacterium sp. 7A]|uniref:ATP-binding response regulator n=1 Tax=Flavobacterium sp. 7A TaxID=2940571 RepID=UPI0022271440|nr:hybrid sensor histidine kinase/response regulator [Flavobacterium sp. 7A]MCW2120200.1 signal transduction histidine kinase [Flavobacterium sp. 7A]